MPDANAHPKKRFFIDMFTRDISLEECILDLLDNSIDGLIRSKNIRPEEISKSMFSAKQERPNQNALPRIDLTYSEHEIKIKDVCGGIDYNYALTEVFNFGHTPGTDAGHLGVYGIGLKRALFKIGDYFVIKSHTINNGFKCELDVRKWVVDDERMDQWTIPITQLDGVSAKQAGTEITVTNLHKEVKMRLNDGMLATTLDRRTRGRPRLPGQS